jgi:hypothetical protein
LSGAAEPSRLAPAPRLVPWSVQARTLLAAPEASVGWLLLAFGLVLTLVFAPKIDLTTWYWYRGSLQRAPARLENCWSEGPAANAQAFSFMIAGLNYRGVSYGASPCLLAGEPVVVEFPADRPDLARLPGSSAGLYGPSAALILALPLLGLAVLVVSFLRGLSILGLLTNGRLARARLAAKKLTWKRAAGSRIHLASYSFTDEGGIDRLFRLEILGDELPLGSEELVLYHLDRPDDARLAQELLDGLELSQSGEILPSGTAQALVAASLPALTIGFSAWLLLSQLLRGR